jgi:hypothetical protein
MICLTMQNDFLLTFLLPKNKNLLVYFFVLKFWGGVKKC